MLPHTKSSTAKVTPDAAAVDLDQDKTARERLVALASTSKSASVRFQVQMLCLASSPESYIENIKNMMTALGVTCALIWGVNVGNLREPTEGLAANNAALQACGILNAISTIAGFLAILCSMVMYIQFDLIPDGSSLKLVEDALIKDGLINFVLWPQKAFVVQFETLLSALCVETVYVYGSWQPAGWVMVGLAGVFGLLGPGYVFCTFLPRRRATVAQQFQALLEKEK